MFHRITFSLLALLMASPLAAQNWDLRLEAPFPQGQSLPQTMILGSTQLISGDSNKGNGAILSLQHRLIRVGPVLRLDWGGEISYLKAIGDINAQLGSGSRDSFDSTLKQYGLGVGINAQLWVPFVGLCGEIGVIQRFQRYSFTTSQDARSDGTIGRTWLRVGARFRLPSLGVHPYIAASYQQPINKDQPVRISSVEDLASYLQAQGKGQEFQRMWTFGVGVTF